VSLVSRLETVVFCLSYPVPCLGHFLGFHLKFNKNMIQYPRISQQANINRQQAKMTFQFACRKLQRSKDLEPAGPANEPMNYEPWTMDNVPRNTQYDIRNTRYEFEIRDTRYAIRHTSICPLHLSRILYKSDLFMQNKPNFKDAQMNVSIFSKMAYENICNWTLGEIRKTNPKQTQLPKG